MSMTHYMELLATNQPWNLLLFMAIPVILAETVAITELYLLFTRATTGKVKLLSRVAGIGVGLYFIGVIVYLIPNAVIPITSGGQWRTSIDVIAVGAYLLSGIPLILIALQELKITERKSTPERKLATHAIYVAVFLVLAHVAMIAGMLDPALLGYSAPHAMDMAMPGMEMPANGHAGMDMPMKDMPNHQNMQQMNCMEMMQNMKPQQAQ